MSRKIPFLAGSLHILVLSGFALAQPLYSLLSGYPEFFVARQSEPVDPIILALILSLGLPSLLILFEGLARLAGHGLHTHVHSTLISVLTTAILLQLLKYIPALPGVVTVSAAVLLAIMVSLAYLRFDTIRTYLTFLAPVVLLFPGLFLLTSDVSRIVFPEQVELQLEEVEATAPVVMVVLDELPLTSLMDEQRRIDPVRFPNFARLAGDSYWFRNATTVSDSTQLSVPAIVSGLSPQLQEPRIPTTADYPETLFTLLGGSYRLEVFENSTRLSPAPRTEIEQTMSERMNSLLSDLAIVYGHVLLPTDLASALPPVDRSWNNFGSTTPEPVGTGDETEDGVDAFRTLDDFSYDAGNRAGRFREFIDSIQVNDQPALFFLHSMLPHTPWQYLPSGRQYSLMQSSIPGMTRADSGYGSFPAWGNDPLPVNQGYRRHLLQVAFVDTLLGDLIDRLEAIGLYDRSLVVVTADHGMSFRTNDFSRRTSETNHPDIMWIPLFLKVPHQEQGVVDDRNVETIDILPTIADALGIDMPWQTDGRSALDRSSPERPGKTILAGRTQEFVADSDSDSQGESLQKMLELFGSGTRDFSFADSLYADLLGQHSDEFGFADAGIGVELDGEPFFENVNLDSPFLLTHVTGQIAAEPGSYPSRHLAVAVNDTVGAVAEMSPGASEFSALVPETAFQPGRNDVQIFFVAEVDGTPRLERLSRESSPSYSLIDDGQTETLQASDGESIPIVPGDALGYVRTERNEESETVVISGWAAGVEQPELGAEVLIFQNRQLLYSGTPRIVRPDVAEAYPEWALLTTGFNFGFPLANFEDREQTEVRVFALTPAGTASELRYVRDTWVFAFSVDEPADVAADGDALSMSLSDVEAGAGVETVRTSNGETIPIAVGDALGYARAIGSEERETVVISGWAAGVEQPELGVTILIFQNRQLLHSGTPAIVRPDVAEVYPEWASLTPGYRFEFPLADFEDREETEVRVFALTPDGTVSELGYIGDTWVFPLGI